MVEILFFGKSRTNWGDSKQLVSDKRNYQRETLSLFSDRIGLEKRFSFSVSKLKYVWLDKS